MNPASESEFAAMAERHRRELHVHCYRMMGSFQDAEDLVQETLLRAWRKRETLEDDKWFRAWLYKIATNACLDSIKAKGRRPPDANTPSEIPWLTAYPDRLLDEVAPEDEQPEATLVGRETIELTFLAVIQLLPPRQRAVLIMRDVLDWPADRTAEVLDIGVAAVNSALQRARATIQQQLPPGRREDWQQPEASEIERKVLEGFMATHENGDTDAALAMIANDVRVTMPPHPFLFEGIDAIRGLMEQAGDEGQWKLIPTRANRMPAAASYLRKSGDDDFRAFKLDVLRIHEGKIAEITTFGSDLFPEFGLLPIL